MMKIYAQKSYENDDEFTIIFDEATMHFNQYMKETEDIDGVSNLALLDEKTNRQVLHG